MIYRIAVCLSGELRTWDYCKENIKSYFEDGNKLPHGYNELQVDYFIHTWNQERQFLDINGRNTGPNERSQCVNTTDLEKAIEWYAPKKHIVETQSATLWETKYWGGFARSSYRANMLKSQYEHELGFEYDCVIRSRFDVMYCNDTMPITYRATFPKDRIFHDCKLVFMTEFNLDSVDDVFYFGSSTSMDKLADFYPWYMKRVGYNTFYKNMHNKSILRKQHSLSFFGPVNDHKYMGPGTLMHVYMNKYFLMHESVDILMPTIVRPAATVFDFTNQNDRAKMGDVLCKSHIRDFNDTHAVIFDLDGVIVNSNEYHHSALMSATSAIICKPVDHTLVDVNSMKSSVEKIKILQQHYQFEDELCDTILQTKDTMFRQHVRSATISQDKIDLFEFLKKKDVKMAIASNSRMNNIMLILESLGIVDYFDAIVSGQDDVARSKPYPDIIFEVYNRLDIAQKYERFRTILIEDSLEGAQAGLATATTVIKVNDPSDVNIELIRKWTE